MNAPAFIKKEVETLENRSLTFSQEEIQLIKDTICKGSSDTELKLFLHQCRSTGLNPLARQIYSVERKEYRDGTWKATRSIQVSIDGFRLIAERSGKYAGQTEPQWCGSDGVWKDAWLSAEPPVAARIGVLRNDFKEPCYAVARFDAYAQKNKESKLTTMWAKMSDVMIAKCAEALALRKAFPQELSGLYTADEMAQAEIPRDEGALTGELTAKQAYGSTKLMKAKFEEIATKINAAQDEPTLTKIGPQYKLDFANFKAIDETLYDNLCQLWDNRLRLIREENQSQELTEAERAMDEQMNRAMGE